ncbi:MAG: DNA-3-methyladenine glycosylase 2 family protein, partial [Cyanobacteria bacterium J06628_4]
DRLVSLGDQQVRDRLMTIKGIGLWTANIYLLLALKRPDIWPNGDLALHAAIQQIKGLPQRPTSAEAQAMSVAWQPWRAVAARLLWHFYLTERQQTMPQ